jgi:hypothetical protein
VKPDREPSPLVLLGHHELVGEPIAFSLALLRLLDEPGVLEGPRREVGEHGRPDEVATPVGLSPLDREDPDRRAPHRELHVHAAVPETRRRERDALLEVHPVGAKEPLRLRAGLVENLPRRDRPGNLGNRLHERLEEARLRL